MKRKQVYIEKIVNGKTVESYPLTAADDDWIRAGRLAEKAEAGDKEAAKELAEMVHSTTYIVDELPIDKEKDEKFKDWIQSVKFKARFEPDPEDEDD